MTGAWALRMPKSVTRIPRISNSEALILELLLERGDMYGLEMSRASSGLDRRSIYMTLGHMVHKGLLTSRKATGACRGPYLRLYRLTERGAGLTRLLATWHALGL